MEGIATETPNTTATLPSGLMHKAAAAFHQALSKLPVMSPQALKVSRVPLLFLPLIHDVLSLAKPRWSQESWAPEAPGP